MKHELQQGIGKLLVKEQRFDSLREIGLLLRYITRARLGEERRKELIAWGARGAQYSKGIERVISQFIQVQRNYDWNDPRYRRHCYHEVFSFKDLIILQLDAEWWNSLAFRMSQIYWENGHQVVYAVHGPDRGAGGLHIHFAVNTVSMIDGRKWHSSFRDRAEREKCFCRIAEAFFREETGVEN